VVQAKRCIRELERLFAAIIYFVSLSSWSQENAVGFHNARHRPSLLTLSGFDAIGFECVLPDESGLCYLGKASQVIASAIAERRTKSGRKVGQWSKAQRERARRSE
jgi:hypothetical protein